jgi:type IV pilus biogenesis protein PilP
VADPKTAGTETAGTPPIPPTRPEDAPGAQPSPEPESLSGADEPSAHALAAAPRPLPKPVSAKDLVEAADLAPTALAAATAPRPVRKPAGLKRRAGALATARAAARDKARLAAKASDGKTVSGGRRKQIPASASLAAAATNRNAVDLSQTILVGVFGSPTSRRAILRLPSGDIRRVKKGESIEGWKVATIGQSSIKLTKSGKSQTLNVPGE